MATTEKSVPFEEVTFRRFHLHIGFSGCGGQFADGFELGIIGIAVAIAAGPLQLSALQMGLLGAAALAGLFVGSLITGIVADRIGRRTIFAYDMLFAAAISGAQFFATEPWHLLALRLMLGFVLGADYVVSKSLVTELSPIRFRGRLLSLMAIAWAAGYTVAYVAGFLIRDTGPDAWRYMLAISSAPALCIFLFRMSIPESPLWLIKRGRVEEARQIILKKLGPDVALPKVATEVRKRGGEWAALFSPKWRRRTAVGGIFYVCQVIPYFALGTFLPKIMEALHVTDKYSGSLVYNTFLMLGAIIGMVVIDRLSRRFFLISTFYIGAGLLLLLSVNVLGSTGVIIVFALFALTLSAAANLEFMYPPELFPTHLRATGVGLAVAASRFGSALSTFLLPLVVQTYGVGTALVACVVVMVFGGVVCQAWAPETGHVHLDSIGEAEDDRRDSRSVQCAQNETA
ncbi:MFS transporter [Azospirillum formosense]|uniref:MFS transporter n=2 Tax=Azospirillum formosense TaxID=861533 RepID=A0ABX2KYV1_9PROT|nr:MFS transporter [Azospirillum formosense]NUB18718.1 MFS transporter [Azospirillum formosense]